MIFMISRDSKSKRAMNENDQGRVYWLTPEERGREKCPWFPISTHICLQQGARIILLIIKFIDLLRSHLCDHGPVPMLS